MGDYNKLIVNCSLKNMSEDEIEEFKKEALERIYLSSSAYQCGGEVFELDNHWHHRTDMVLITQTKWGRNIQDFIKWLTPQATQGSGEDDVIAMEFSEYDKEPRLYKLNQTNES